MKNKQLKLNFSDDDLTFKDYENIVSETAIYPNVGTNFVYPLLGLAGEVGEIHEKFKKLMRDGKGYDTDGYLTFEFKKDIVNELGDVLWYISALALEIGTDLEMVANNNYGKLMSRRERGVISGSGDNR